MKKILLVVLLMTIVFTGCESSSIGIIGGADGPTAIYVSEDDKWGITLLAENVTNSGITLKIKQKGGKDVKELSTGTWYELEKFEDNAWVKVSTNPLIDYAWEMVAYNIKPSGVTEFEVDWEWLYGKVSPGAYRLAKEIMNFDAPGDYEKEIYYAYFTVE